MEPEVLLCFLPGPLPKPSLRAEPGPVIPRGRPVTFVCKSPVWAQLFRLEKDERFVHSDQESASHVGETEVRFHIPAVSEDTAGPYSCLYRQGFVWSELSEPLQLQVTEEDVSTPPSGGSRGPAPVPAAFCPQAPCPPAHPQPWLPSLCTQDPRPPPLAQGPGVWSHVDTTVAWTPSPASEGTQSCPAGLGGA